VSLWGINKAVIYADIMYGIREFIQLTVIFIIPTFVVAVFVYYLHDKKKLTSIQKIIKLQKPIKMDFCMY
jgi:hypothetical protein